MDVYHLVLQDIIDMHFRIKTLLTYNIYTRTSCNKLLVRSQAATISNGLPTCNTMPYSHIIAIDRKDWTANIYDQCHSAHVL